MNTTNGHSDFPASETRIPEVYPVLVVTVGTTMAELALLVHSQLSSIPDPVPMRLIVIDSLRYADVRSRLVSAGWTAAEVEAAIPRSQFLHLSNPFDPGFDFDDPANERWTDTIFEPSLRRLVVRPGGPGCGGTPALGRAWVEGNASEVRTFLDAQIQLLTQVRTRTLALQRGLRIMFVTTFRGGTGTGVALPCAGLAREAHADASISLHVVMPGVYGADERAAANAVAQLREIRQFQRDGGCVPFAGEAPLPPAFDDVCPTFESNGAVSLKADDALMRITGVILAHARARTQSAINARLSDLTDLPPFDGEGAPLHVRIETGLTVRPIHPDVEGFLATEWLCQEVDHASRSVETWVESGTLAQDETRRVREVVSSLTRDLGLGFEALGERLEPTPPSGALIRTFFERLEANVHAMSAADVQRGLAGLVLRGKDIFPPLEREWRERAASLARDLAGAIVRGAAERFPTEPHLALATLGALLGDLPAIAEQARARAASEQARRDSANTALPSALNAAQSATGWLGVLGRNEVTRDAAHRACEIASVACLARAAQERAAIVAQVIDGELVGRDGRGRTTSVPSLKMALNAAIDDLTTRTRQDLVRTRAEIVQARDLHALRLQRTSEIFQRSLVLPLVTPETLRAQVEQLRADREPIPPVTEFLRAEIGLSAAVDKLRPFLPCYIEGSATFEQLLQSSPTRRHEVIELLRNCPDFGFVPLRRDVQDHLAMRERRDDFLIVEVPGGVEGPIGRLVLAEGIVTRPDQIVDSGCEEVRCYYTRRGLPYHAVQPLQRYEDRYTRHCARTGNITPHSTRAGIEAEPLVPRRRSAAASPAPFLTLNGTSPRGEE